MYGAFREGAVDRLRGRNLPNAQSGDGPRRDRLGEPRHRRKNQDRRGRQDSDADQTYGYGRHERASGHEDTLRLRGRRERPPHTGEQVRDAVLQQRPDAFRALFMGRRTDVAYAHGEERGRQSAYARQAKLQLRTAGVRHLLRQVQLYALEQSAQRHIRSHDRENHRRQRRQPRVQPGRRRHRRTDSLHTESARRGTDARR